MGKTYTSEKEYVDALEIFLIKNGFKVWREVVPDRCKNWDQPWRVDLIAYHLDVGYIGVEAKNMNTLRSGGKIAGAIEQLKRYRGETYFDGINIDNWSLGCPHQDFNDGLRDLNLFLSYFLGYYNLLFLEFEENRIVLGKNSKSTLYISDKISGSLVKNKLEEWF